MDRLKQEWKETRIPNEVLLRARNGAWAKIQRPPAARRRLGRIAVASTIIAVVILLLVWKREEPRIETVSVPAVRSAPRPAVIATQTISPRIEATPLPKPKLVKKHIASPRAGDSAEEHERIVLNFKLPESGARMIWVIDSRFQLDGGVK
jgi:hypothetical protein